MSVPLALDGHKKVHESETIQHTHIATLLSCFDYLCIYKRFCVFLHVATSVRGVTIHDLGQSLVLLLIH